MGSATATQPADGWATSDLSIYFGRSYSPTSRSPTRLISPTATSSGTGTTDDHVNVGAIAGGTVGGVAALVAVMLACYFIWKRKRVDAVTRASQVPMRDQEHSTEGVRSPPSLRISLPSPWSQTYSPHSQDGKWQPPMPQHLQPQQFFQPPPDPQQYDDLGVMHEMPSSRTPALLDNDRQIPAEVTGEVSH